MKNKYILTTLAVYPDLKPRVDKREVLPEEYDGVDPYQWVNILNFRARMQYINANGRGDVTALFHYTLGLND